MMSSPRGGILARSIRKCRGSAMLTLLRISAHPGVECPEMLGGVSAPGPPRLGAPQEIGGRRPRAVTTRGASQQADVTGGKGIALAQRTQRDVLRRPFANAGDG